jgi:hypothetical protein
MIQRATVHDIINGFERTPIFKFVWGHYKWSIHDESYTYRGTGNDRTVMTTVVFYKEKGLRRD